MNNSVEKKLAVQQQREISVDEVLSDARLCGINSGQTADTTLLRFAATLLDRFGIEVFDQLDHGDQGVTTEPVEGP